MTETTTATPKAASNASKHYAAAEKALREAHRDEFEALLAAEYEKAGETRIRRLTPAERDAKIAAEARAKAEAKMQEILQVYPDLAPVTAAVQSEAAPLA